MTKPLSTRATRAAKQFGESVTVWRKLQNLTAEQVADRAGLNRVTFSKVEHGDPTVRFGAVLEVLRALGQLEVVLKSADPYESELGRIRGNDALPERVRQKR